MTDRENRTESDCVQESRIVELTSELLQVITATMYTEGKYKLEPSEISENWDQLWYHFGHEAGAFRSATGTIVLDMAPTKSIQELKAAVVSTMGKATGRGLLTDGARSKMSSDNRARFCDSYMVRKAVELHLNSNMCDVEMQDPPMSFQRKSLLELYQELYGDNVGDYTNQASMEHLVRSGFDEGQIFLHYTNDSYRQLTGLDLDFNYEETLWNTREGRTALVKGSRRTMEYMVTHGTIKPEVVGEHGSHDEAERVALQKLGLLPPFSTGEMVL